jgi:hypothetical protein
MRFTLETRLTLVLSALCFGGAASLAAQVPVIQKAEPNSGRIGSVMRVQGDHLGKTLVDEVYLSDHTFDLKVKVLEQNDDSIEFRIPPFVKPGRLQLVVRTAGKEPVILEQPVYITVEEPKETLQASAAAPAPPEAPAPANPPAQNTPPADGTK